MSRVKEVQALAEDLERALGDPHDRTSPLSFARAMALDEAERYPHELLGFLMRHGFHAFAVPPEHGGRAVHVEDELMALRLVARRDPTTAMALAITHVAYLPLWLAGSQEQRSRYARAVLDGGMVAWALSERSHGSDVLANTTAAERVPGGYLLTGEKWLIGNATLARTALVFARTRQEGGPAGYSIFVVDKDTAPAGAVRELPRERLHGTRGIDISGVALQQCFVPEANRLGREGEGLEIALKSVQPVRVIINALPLGAADTALRLTLDFARRRHLFGTSVSELPHPKAQLVACFCDLVIADAVTAASARVLQAAPQYAGVWSSVTKYFVPGLLEGTVTRLADVLGSRHYLRSHPRYSVFQKMMRDLRVAVFAEGNAATNLRNVAAALGGLLAPSTPAAPHVREAVRERCPRVFDLDADLPPYDPKRHSLYGRGVDYAVLGLPGAADDLLSIAAGAVGTEADLWRRCAAVARRFLGEIDRLRTEHGQLRTVLGRDFGRSAELFELAGQYCVVHAAGCLVQLTVRSWACLTEPFPSGSVLLACLDRLWRQLHPTQRVTDRDVVDAAAAALYRLHDDNRLFSLRNVVLAHVPT
ncbi:acyl-CoA dehydrogenase family protein [Streptomyces celluloflavus]|uniref:acyl-CoA dehydrogenase family protein n=1 Tax=Streptomyces celluloflavus TaxID=58344 RepID=UPI0036A96715